MQKIAFIFALLLLMGSSAMAQTTDHSAKRTGKAIEQLKPSKSLVIGNMAVGKTRADASKKGNFVSPTGVNIEWEAKYSTKHKSVTSLKINTEREQSTAFWTAQATALDKPEVFSALAACLEKDDEKNFSPCMQALIQSKMK